MKYITIIALSLLAAGCGDNSSVNEQESDTEEEVVQMNSGHELQENDSIISCTGTISVPPESMISLYTPIKGIVNSIKVIEGQKVNKGELLAIIEHMDIIRIQEEYLTSRASYDQASKEFERKQGLHDKAVISDREFEQSRSEFEQARSKYQSLKKQLEFIGISTKQVDNGSITQTISIHAPANSYVTSIYVNKGAFANQDSKLFDLVDDSHKHLHLKVYPDDLPKIEEGQKIRFKTAGSEKVYEAEVFRIGKKVDETDNSIDIHAHLKEDGIELIYGTFVFAEIIVK